MFNRKQIFKDFPNAEKVIDWFHVQKLAFDALQAIRIVHRWEAIDVETNDMENSVLKRKMGRGLKTQMGTNLLNLFPSPQTSELVVVPGYGYYGWPFCLDFACALSAAFRPLPSVTPFYNCNFRFSFRNPCGSLP